MSERENKLIDYMVICISEFAEKKSISTKEAFNKKVDAFEKTEIIKNSKIDKEIKKTGVVVYEK